MAEYKNDEALHNTVGKQIIKFVTTNGTAQMQMQLTDEGFGNVTDGFFNTVGTTTKEITLPECDIKVTLTGDATFFMSDSQ